jgi:hypothetical protein
MQEPPKPPAPPAQEDAIIGYVGEVEKSKFIPGNQYEHAFMLVDSEDEQENNIPGMGKYTKLVSKDIQLATVGNDLMLQFYQTDAKLLTYLFGMAIREPSLRETFRNLYHGWRNELLLTKTKGGTERKMQGAAGTAYTPREPLPGYGSEMQQLFQQNEDKGNFLQKLLKRK